jgi:hypothetical protein
VYIYSNSGVVITSTFYVPVAMTSIFYVPVVITSIFYVPVVMIITSIFYVPVVMIITSILGYLSRIERMSILPDSSARKIETITTLSALELYKRYSRG